jgi:hypothetical protein
MVSGEIKDLQYEKGQLYASKSIATKLDSSWDVKGGMNFEMGMAVKTLQKDATLFVHGAIEGEQVERYLPKMIDNKTVLIYNNRVEGTWRSTWRVTNEYLGEEVQDGISYSLSNHTMSPDILNVKFGSIIEGTDVGKGWVRVMATNPKAILEDGDRLLRLRNGKPMFEIGVKTNTHFSWGLPAKRELPCDQSVNDGKWHNITVSYRFEMYHMSIDGRTCNSGLAGEFTEKDDANESESYTGVKVVQRTVYRRRYWSCRRRSPSTPCVVNPALDTVKSMPMSGGGKVENVTYSQDLLSVGDHWSLDRLDSWSGCDGSFNPHYSGQGVHVYVLDTGIRTTHDDFEGRALPGAETIRTVKTCNQSDIACAYDMHGHGSHVAGIIAGRKAGVAKFAKVHAVKVLDNTNKG